MSPSWSLLRSDNCLHRFFSAVPIESFDLLGFGEARPVTRISYIGFGLVALVLGLRQGCVM